MIVKNVARMTREEIARRMDLPHKCSWEDILRVYFCKQGGLDMDTDWDDAWRICWCRFLSIDDSSSHGLVRDAVRRNDCLHRDPCDWIACSNALEGLGLSARQAFQSEEFEAVRQRLCNKYRQWRTEVIG